MRVGVLMEVERDCVPTICKQPLVCTRPKFYNKQSAFSSPSCHSTVALLCPLVQECCLPVCMYIIIIKMTTREKRQVENMPHRVFVCSLIYCLNAGVSIVWKCQKTMYLFP